MKKYLIAGAILLAGLLGWYFYPQTTDTLFGADSGALSPQSVVSDATVGTVAWSNPDRAVSQNQSYASVDNLLSSGGDWQDTTVKIVKADGSIGTTNKGGSHWQDYVDVGLPIPLPYISYGGAADLWDETWTSTDINDADFGVVLSAKRTTSGVTSHYLKASNFGFSIPAGATIDGILAEISGAIISEAGYSTGYVDHIRITVYYTEAITNNPQVQVRSGTINVRSGSIIVK